MVAVGDCRGLSWDLACLTSLSATCRRQEKALLWGLRVTRNLGDQSIGRGAGWRDEPARMLLVIGANKAVLSYTSTGCGTKFTDPSQSPPVLLSTMQPHLLVLLLFNLSLKVDYWALTSAKGQETSLHRTIFISSFSSFAIPQALVNLIKSFSDWNPSLPKLQHVLQHVFLYSCLSLILTVFRYLFLGW